ncbi:MAG: hypothetical protein Q8M09_03615 [Pseudomonadota bacterium]|nr:hypothetical protein [Pseudomonadota bacterium]MDP1903324.1 hypothetical protein [Pseudomonadota bacterium]MDP2352534.1 hypothetical protein [Pseudomonadota bacterium]
MLAPGLSLEQAPPFSVPLRFILVAPLFLFAAGLVAALRPEWAATSQAPVTLALTHLVTLGFLGMAMLGAMSQMLPVVAGAPLPSPRGVAWVSHIGLLLGTPLLALGLERGESALLSAGSSLIGLGLLVFLGAAGLALMRAPASDTTRAMRLAAFTLGITLCLGLGLASWLIGLWSPAAPVDWLAGHVLWGLGGWIGVLVMGSAWQVVPMLQLTPPYPLWLTRWLWRGMLIGLPLATLVPAPWHGAGLLLVALALLAFAIATLYLQSRRKRKLSDTTLDFWRLGMASLIAAVPLALAHALYGLPDAWVLLAGLLFLVGFAASVVSGMLYKILPFLAWFHLQARRGFKLGQPSMRDYLPEARARGHFRLHLVALACLLAAPFLNWLALPAGLLLAASAVWLGWNLLQTWLLYRRADAAAGR